MTVALKEGTTTITVESMNAKTTKYKVVVKSTKKVNTIKVKAKTKSVKLGKKKISAKKFKFTKTGKLTVTKGNSKFKPETVIKTVNIKIK